jgi:hypothetical protein
MNSIDTSAERRRFRYYLREQEVLVTGYLALITAKEEAFIVEGIVNVFDAQPFPVESLTDDELDEIQAAYWDVCGDDNDDLEGEDYPGPDRGDADPEDTEEEDDSE